MRDQRDLNEWIKKEAEANNEKSKLDLDLLQEVIDETAIKIRRALAAKKNRKAKIKGKLAA